MQWKIPFINQNSWGKKRKSEGTILWNLRVFIGTNKYGVWVCKSLFHLPREGPVKSHTKGKEKNRKCLP